jgi:hypothetical protein
MTDYDRRALETRMAQCARLRESGFRFPLAIKKMCSPRPEDFAAAHPRIDHARVTWQVHVTWFFARNVDREVFMSWIGYDPDRHHPANLIVLEDYEYRKENPNG